VPDQIHPAHQTLFNAATIGNVDLANRVALAPMTRVSATADGLPTDRIASYYCTFAQCGFAPLITEGNSVSLGL
jgi:2,4-dienoyl-CoA reductase-like NADH-dependent reductase (Old Yellow Enzyme family)